MNHNDKTIENQEQAALYALGVLCQHEARAFEEQLRDGDPQLRSDLFSFERVVDIIGCGAPAAEPPGYLLDILLTRLEKEGQVSGPAKVMSFHERGSAATPSPATPTSRPEPPSASFPASFPAPVASRPQDGPSAFLPWAIAASLLVCSIVGFLAWRNARQESDELRTQVAVIQDQTEKLRQQVNAENERVLELARINEVLSSPDHRVIEMSGSADSPNSSGKIYWDTRASQWAVVAKLPPAPAGKVYQLWFVTPDAKISAGLIKPDHSGHAFTVLKVPPDVSNVAAAAITLEPEGGSAQPTMPIYTLGKV